MTKIHFSDGIEFDLSDALRVEQRHDGFYVVGDGKLIPVASEEEGERIVAELHCPHDYLGDFGHCLECGARVE